MVVPDAGGETLLHHAAFHGKVHMLCPRVLETSLTMCHPQVLILEWLLDRVKNSSEKIPDVVDDSGVTPAHFAAQQGHLDCLQVSLNTFPIAYRIEFLICSFSTIRAVA